MVPEQSGHMNQTTSEHGESRRSQYAMSSQAPHAELRARSALPLLDSVACDPCPSRWRRALTRIVPASLVLLGALALGTAGSGTSPAAGDSLSGSSLPTLAQLARSARMQLVAADAVYAPQSVSQLTGAASDLTPTAGDSRSERAEKAKKRREAAEARRAAAKERRAAARQARLEAKGGKASARGSDDEEDDDEEEKLERIRPS